MNWENKLTAFSNASSFADNMTPVKEQTGNLSSNHITRVRQQVKGDEEALQSF